MFIRSIYNKAIESKSTNSKRKPSKASKQYVNQHIIITLWDFTRDDHGRTCAAERWWWRCTRSVAHPLIGARKVLWKKGLVALLSSFVWGCDRKKPIPQWLVEARLHTERDEEFFVSFCVCLLSDSITFLYHLVLFFFFPERLRWFRRFPWEAAHSVIKARHNENTFNVDGAKRFLFLKLFQEFMYGWILSASQG